jgi:hypothetical protein
MPTTPVGDMADGQLTWVERFLRLTGIDVTHCAKCGGDVFSRALDRPKARDTS